jgi:hypothetical protein
MPKEFVNQFMKGAVGRSLRGCVSLTGFLEESKFTIKNKKYKVPKDKVCCGGK